MAEPEIASEHSNAISAPTPPSVKGNARPAESADLDKEADVEGASVGDEEAHEGDADIAAVPQEDASSSHHHQQVTSHQQKKRSERTAPGEQPPKKTKAGGENVQKKRRGSGGSMLAKKQRRAQEEYSDEDSSSDATSTGNPAGVTPAAVASTSALDVISPVDEDFVTTFDDALKPVISFCERLRSSSTPAQVEFVKTRLSELLKSIVRRSKPVLVSF